MSDRLLRLHAEFGQSPWLDNLHRDLIDNGDLQRLIADGVRGLTTNPTIFQKAIQSTTTYDHRIRVARRHGATITEVYWDVILDDIADALDAFEGLHQRSGGEDGWVSVEVDPGIADDSRATIEQARALHRRIDRPNVMIKIPATEDGISAIRTMTAEGCSVNATLIFGLQRYREVAEAYLEGLEMRLAAGDDLAGVASVASFFVSRVDTEVDLRLRALRGDDADSLLGRTAIAQARCAYEIFTELFSGLRWEALRRNGAQIQRPLWASTSTKDPAYPDTMYVDALIGPATVSTLPDATLQAFADHGTLRRTVDLDFDQAHATLDRLRRIGIDLGEVSEQLENEGVAAFRASFDDLMVVLEQKAIDD